MDLIESLDPTFNESKRGELGELVVFVDGPDIDPEIGLNTKIEQVRQKEIREGTLYNCPKNYHAARIVRDKREYCEGYKVGVGGIGTAYTCLDCPHYLSTGREKPSPKK